MIRVHNPTSKVQVFVHDRAPGQQPALVAVEPGTELDVPPGYWRSGLIGRQAPGLVEGPLPAKAAPEKPATITVTAPLHGDDPQAFAAEVAAMTEAAGDEADVVVEPTPVEPSSSEELETPTETPSGKRKRR